MPPETMIPEARLEELLEQALSQQLSSAEFTGPTQLPVSLLADLCHSRVHVPTRTVQVILLNELAQGSAENLEI